MQHNCVPAKYDCRRGTIGHESGTFLSVSSVRGQSAIGTVDDIGVHGRQLAGQHRFVRLIRSVIAETARWQLFSSALVVVPFSSLAFP
jgi:hypothetical protein